MKTDININGPTAVVGDIHGVAYEMNLRDLPDKCNIILLGDIGVGFNSNIIYKLSTMYPEHQFYLIRGNHDDPSYWEDAPFRIGRNITFIPDGYLTINSELYLAIGGSISVDRYMSHRIPMVTWWPNEVVRWTIPQRCRKVKGILSHSGPTPAMLVGKKISQPDPEGKIHEYLEWESSYWRQIEKRFKPKVWYHGHFHMHNVTEHKNLKIYSLDCNEIMLL